jgi:hypothetical protein
MELNLFIPYTQGTLSSNLHVLILNGYC